jgi:AcrR family transcriptional regulator
VIYAPAVSSHELNASQEVRAPQARGIATRDRLLLAASELFARDGYEGTSIGDIAHRAGVGVGTVYHHFEDKRSLLLELLTAREAVPLIDEAEERPLSIIGETSDRRAAIEKVIRVFAEIRREGPTLEGAAVDLARRDPAVRGQCERITRAREDFLRRNIEGGQQAGRVRADLDATSAALWIHKLVNQAMTMLATAEDDPDTDRALYELSEMIHRYLFES